jgi:hypothetical protein
MGEMFDGADGAPGLTVRAIRQTERRIGDVTARGQLEPADAGHPGLAAELGEELLGGRPMTGDAGEHGGIAFAGLGGELGGQYILGGLGVGTGQAAAVGPLPGQGRAKNYGNHDQGDPGQENTTALAIARDGDTAEQGGHASNRKYPPRS